MLRHCRIDFSLRAAVAAAVMTLPALAFGQAQAATEPTGIATYERKSLTYKPLDNRAGAPNDIAERAAGVVRRSVEQSRFDINDLGRIRDLEVDELARLTRQYLDEVKLERAAETAEYNIQYKDLDITAEDLQRVADSAFIYAPTLEHWRLDHESAVVKIRGAPVRIDTYSAEVAVTVIFYKLDFAAGTAEPAWRIRARGRALKSSSPPVIPASVARTRAIDGAFNELWLDMKTKVRRLEPFRMAGNIAVATRNGAYIEGTAADGIHLDTLFEVREQYKDGGDQRVGWAIVREVGHGDENPQSYLRTIAADDWRFSGGEMLVERAQRGEKYYLEYQQVFSTVRGAGEVDGAEDMFGLRLGYTRNIAEGTGISEFHLGGMLGVGFIGEFVELNPEFGFEKLWNWRRLFFGFGARGGTIFALTSLETEEIVHARSFGGTFEGRLMLWLTPNLSLQARGGYRAYTNADELFTDFDDDVAPEGFKYKPSGVQFGLGIAMHR